MNRESAGAIRSIASCLGRDEAAHCVPCQPSPKFNPELESDEGRHETSAHSPAKEVFFERSLAAWMR
jgi:hypothetical protein